MDLTFQFEKFTCAKVYGGRGYQKGGWGMDFGVCIFVYRLFPIDLWILDS